MKLNLRGAAITLLLLWSLPIIVHATDDGLVGRVVQRYTSLENYYVRGTFFFAAGFGEMSQQFEAPFIQAGSAPGKLRLEIDDEQLGSVIVSDGEQTWTYFKLLDQYKREAAVPLEGVGRGGEQSSPAPAANKSFLDLYVSLGDEGAAWSVVGEEDIQWGDRLIRCTVIASTPTATDPSGLSKGPDTLWVDPDRALVLKSVHRTEGQLDGTKTTTRMELTFDDILVDEAPPDELFDFEPPDGAKEVEDFTSGGVTRTDLSGEDAPDFQLTDLDGRSHRLADYRGKVVVLNFWASWCAPCRKELPAIERLHRQYGGEGLVVLAVNSESRKVAGSFIRKYGYTFTVLSDVEGSVVDDYAVASIPVTIVVDKEGRISAHFTGYQKEEELLAAIRRAGVQ